MTGNSHNLDPKDSFSNETQQMKVGHEADESIEDQSQNFKFRKFENVVFDSISLYLEESPLLQAPSFSSFLNQDFGKYWHYSVPKNEETLAPRLWNLPEIFRKKLTAFSQHSSHEVNRQYRIVDVVHYNFSNGYQISAAEILRHPLFKKVPLHLLPDGKAVPTVFAKWPLLQQADKVFTTQALIELESIMQALLEKITESLRKGEIEVFLQSRQKASGCLPLRSVEFDATQELDWRVEFFEKENLKAEMKLVSFRNKEIYFFESFALEPQDGVLIVHPWNQEVRLLQANLKEQSDNLRIRGPQPLVEIEGEIEIKSVLKYLRARTLPVKIQGESKTYSASQSQIQIHLMESGHFTLFHEARGMTRQGWSSKSALFLQTLSRGLPFLLGVEAREMAARMGSKRDWDLKLLKNLGILQYIFAEVLSFHFDGVLLNGETTVRDKFFESVLPQVRDLLIAGGGSSFVREAPLVELCSKSVLACLENFINISFKALEAQEHFYSENGETILEGAVEREFRLIYQLIQALALSSHGEFFKRSRTSLLSKIAVNQNEEEDLQLRKSIFQFPAANSAVQALEHLQVLIPHGFKIFYKGQPLQELKDDEFHVDFVLKTEAGPQDFNWFELNPKFFLRGEVVDPDRFLSLGSGGVIEFEGKLFLVPQKQLPSLRRLEKFWQKLQKGKAETVRKRNGDKIYQLPRHQTLELLALRASGVGIRGDEEWKKLCAFYDSLGQERKPFPIPASTKAILKPYQVSGVQWLHDLYKLKLGALLADDMGLGKTLQTLTFLDHLREAGELGLVLVVVPSSLVFNWQSESERFTPDLELIVFSSKETDKIGRRLEAREPVVVVATYGLLMEHEAFLTQYKWKILIFDEAQNLKNITTKRTSAARALTAQFKIGLTGTPMENHYGEFYSLVDLLVPGSLGKIEDFRRQFVNTDLVTREELEDLKLKIRPLLLRRTKKEILDQLPAKQETKISIAFEEKQKQIYRDIALSYNQRVQEAIAIQGEASVQLQMLTALLRLRQACSDPAALPNVRYDKVPPKLETLRESLQEIVESGESALVFTQFIQTLTHSVELLKKDGIPVFAIHGGVPSAQRQKILSEFNKIQGGAVLVMTLKTGGVGLNLTKASYVFHLEPWWNPSVENQATDRVHRLGQGRAVQVFRYIMHESLEEKMELLKSRKDHKFQSLLTNSEDVRDLEKGSGSLSKQDFDLLLGLK